MKILIKTKSLVCLLSFFFFSISASAATLICGGTLEELRYHANNKFMIKLSSMNEPVFFCNPEEEWIVPGTSYKTGPEACKMLYSTFLAAKATGKSLASVYFDGDDTNVPESCSTFESWKKVNIRHFIFK